MTKIKPALTAEEWEHLTPDPRLVPAGLLRLAVGWKNGEVVTEYPAIAALALYDQPFGFTREDVKMLRGAAFFLSDHHYKAGGASAASVADRIEALLPPEKSQL